MAAYEFWAQRRGADYKQLAVPSSATPVIDWTADAKIKCSISLECLYDSDVDWLTDQLAVYRRDDAGRTGLGVFEVTTAPIKTDETGLRTQSLTGYDQTYVLTELSRLEQTHTVLAGTNYVDAIREQLLAAGIGQMLLTPTNEVVQTDIAWETGTSRYDIVATLLADINYRDLWFDGDGAAVCEPWTAASVGSRTHFYGGNQGSDLFIEMESEDDTFCAANVFISLVNSADLGTVLRAQAVNDDVSSPLSVQRRGRRIPSVEILDGIASQKALQARANMRKLKSMMSSQIYQFYTNGSNESRHGLNDSMVLQRDGIGLLEEQDWSLECTAGGRMHHSGKKVYYNFDSE